MTAPALSTDQPQTVDGGTGVPAGLDRHGGRSYPWYLRRRVHALLLFALPFLLYVESLKYGPLYVDDVAYYTNPALHGGAAQGLVDLWRDVILSDYSPITGLTVWLDLKLFGLGNWCGPRLHELFWFSLGTLGVYALVLRVMSYASRKDATEIPRQDAKTQREQRSLESCESQQPSSASRLCGFASLRETASRKLAFLIGLFYALHPVCGQSVLWLAERKNIVAFALAMWSVERYFAARTSQGKRKKEKGKRDGVTSADDAPALQDGVPAEHSGLRTQDSGLFSPGFNAFLAFLLAVLAILAKPHAAAIPAMLIAFEMTLGQGSWLRRCLLVLPFAALVFAFLHVSLYFIRTDLNRPLLGGSLFTALLADGPILLRYFWNTLIPTKLTLYYAAIPPDPAALREWLAWAGVLALAGGSLLLARRRALLAFCWLLALAGLGPALNLVPQLAPMTDHYHQWALPGLLLGLAVFVQDMLKPQVSGFGFLVSGSSNATPSPETRNSKPETGNWRILTLSLGAVLFWGSLSFARIPEFESYKTFFDAAVLIEPDSATNWAIYCLRLRASDKEEDRALAGSAGLRALKCPDADRLLAEQRRAAIQQAALALQVSGRPDEAWALAERESAILPESESLSWRRVMLAEVANNLRRYDRTLELLARDFTPAHQQVAAVLRRRCREGFIVPNGFPPLLQLKIVNGRASEEEEVRNYDRAVLFFLAYAHLKSGELEKAFDVAGVLVNLEPTEAKGVNVLSEVYCKLNVPAAAGAVKRFARAKQVAEPVLAPQK